jgi:23S rRNA (adenine2030-N6)-methyltransferase
LHQQDGATLWNRYHKDRQVSVHKRDGYEAVAALLPLPERRGLVFIDPPFERRDETKQVQSALRTGFKKWATGIFFVWYPIKEGAIGDEITRLAVTAGFSRVLRAEFCPYPRGGHSLAGSGIVICNPPWMLEDRLRRLCKELLPILGGDESSWCVESVS